MAKTRKSYKLRRYKTRRNKIKRNKIKRNKRTLRKGLRKRRKTKKLRGGMGFKNVKKRLSGLEKKYSDTLGINDVEKLRKQALDLDAQPIEFEGDPLYAGDTRFDNLKTSLKTFIQTLDTKLENLRQKEGDNYFTYAATSSKREAEAAPQQPDAAAPASQQPDADVAEAAPQQPDAAAPAPQQPDAAAPAPQPELKTGANKRVGELVNQYETNKDKNTDNECNGPVPSAQIDAALKEAQKLIDCAADKGLEKGGGGRRKKTRKRRR